MRENMDQNNSEYEHFLRSDIVKDIFIIPIEDILKKQQLVVRKCCNCKNQFNVWKKKSKYIFKIDFRKGHQISWNLDELIKSYKAKFTRGAISPSPHWAQS